jgi:hypothetical protein
VPVTGWQPVSKGHRMYLERAERSQHDSIIKQCSLSLARLRSAAQCALPAVVSFNRRPVATVPLSLIVWHTLAGSTYHWLAFVAAAVGAPSHAPAQHGTAWRSI